MSDVTFDVDCERVRCESNGEVFDEYLSYGEVFDWIRGGWDLALYVKGWSQPWKLYVDQAGMLRGICPTSDKVRPRVVSKGAERERRAGGG